MENYYDIGTGDLKDIWDSDLDPKIIHGSPFLSDALKLSSDADMQDWFLERDVKMPQVILHDKLMSDALLGTLPIKTEHSYSLNSDGDSMPDSPGSLQTKIDDMDDDCYPAIPMSAATTASSSTKRYLNSNSENSTNSSSTTASTVELEDLNSNAALKTHSSNNTSIDNNAANGFTINLRSSSNSSTSKNQSQQQQQQQQNHPHKRQKQEHKQQNSKILNSTHLETISISASEMDIDDTYIKDEPMSPSSSCPSSPSSQAYGISLNMASMAALTNTNLVFEHKNGSLQLSQTSQNLLKGQQIFLNGDGSVSTAPLCSTVSTASLIGNQNSSVTAGSQRIIIPKINVKMETQSSQQLFGLPPTPPSSLPSDESEGNQSPEHHITSPMSPPNVHQHHHVQHNPVATMTLATTQNSSGTSTTTTTTTMATTSRRSALSSSSASGGSASSSSTNSSSNSISHLITPSGGSNRGYSGGSTRQPIHTPLISSQPKGSTGTLVLTEEEKRTLLAEGYPIPTRLPLTKAEEKSLKKIRRKIKNKISAQESRRKKKEYMDQLERKVEILVSENSDYRKRVETLEDSNANLLNQLAKLQALLNKQNAKKL